MMKDFRKTMAWVLALACMPILCSCGGGGDDEEDYERFIARSSVSSYTFNISQDYLDLCDVIYSYIDGNDRIVSDRLLSTRQTISVTSKMIPSRCGAVITIIPRDDAELTKDSYHFDYSIDYTIASYNGINEQMHTLSGSPSNTLSCNKDKARELLEQVAEMGDLVEVAYEVGNDGSVHETAIDWTVNPIGVQSHYEMTLSRDLLDVAYVDAYYVNGNNEISVERVNTTTWTKNVMSSNLPTRIGCVFFASPRTKTGKASYTLSRSFRPTVKLIFSNGERRTLDAIQGADASVTVQESKLDDLLNQWDERGITSSDIAYKINSDGSFSYITGMAWGRK